MATIQAPGMHASTATYTSTSGQTLHSTSNTIFVVVLFSSSVPPALRKAVGVRYITPHGIRQTCASLLAVLDAHCRAVMRILRHSKTAVTIQTYRGGKPHGMSRLRR
jgi:hypothetical protein